jgi:hypothetical protein
MEASFGWRADVSSLAGAALHWDRRGRSTGERPIRVEVVVCNRGFDATLGDEKK